MGITTPLPSESAAYHHTEWLTHSLDPLHLRVSVSRLASLARFPGYNKYVYEILGRFESACLAPNEYTYRALLRVCTR